MTIESREQKIYAQLGLWWGSRLFELGRDIQDGVSPDDRSGYEHRLIHRDKVDPGTLRKAKMLIEEILHAGYDLHDPADVAEAVRALKMPAIRPRPEAEEEEKSGRRVLVYGWLRQGNLVTGDVVEGRYGDGLVIVEGGFYHHISPAHLLDVRSRRAIPFGIPPSRMTFVERLRLKLMRVSTKPMAEWIDQETGDKFTFEDGTLYVENIKTEGKPTFIGNDSPGGAR